MAVLGLVLEVLVFLFTVLVVGLISEAAVTEDMIVMAEPDKTEIVALRDNSDIDGSFFLGCGHIDDDLYYYYAEKTGHGYSVQKIRADGCYIEYTDGTPCIARQSAGGFKNNWNYILLIPYYSRTTIYVPPGTIDQSFSIDLEG